MGAIDQQLQELREAVLAMAFALGGAIMDIGAHLISTLMKGGGVSMLWGMWLPARTGRWPVLTWR